MPSTMSSAFAPSLALPPRSSLAEASSSRTSLRLTPASRPASRPAARMSAMPASATAAATSDVGTDLDWANLGFQYVQTHCYMKSVYRDGAWGPLESVSGPPVIQMHIAATALHYGCSCFEGLKCFRAKDGVARLFRPDQNAQRMQNSAARLMVPPVPTEVFMEGVERAVFENKDFIPPYGTNGSLYVRPLLFGSGAKIGLQPADEFTFIVMVVPAGDYYKGGLSPVTAIVMEGFDRAAPRGMGNVKVAGNYAADLLPHCNAIDAGYPINLYLDPLNNRMIEEFGTSNFIGLKGNAYVTPGSASVLPSITNKTLMQLARDKGMDVQVRDIDIEEVKDLDEAAACGTAVVVTAVTRILHKGELITIGDKPNEVGIRLRQFYDQVRGIQVGELPDTHGWCHEVEGA